MEKGRFVKFIVVWLSFVVVVVAKNEEPHPHTGKVAPFKSGDPGVKLDNEALSILKSGKPYKTQVQTESAGRGMVVQDVMAPPEIVWDRILDFRSYNKMVPKTVESESYYTEKLGGGKQRIWVRLKVGFPVLKLQFFINHLYDPANNCLTWTLDYGRKSDLDDSVGFWYVIPHPDNPAWSRVYYSVEVSMFAWVPKFVVDFMSKQALTDATAWVKKFSELEAIKQGVMVTTVEEAVAVAGVPAKRGWFGRRKRQSEPETTAVETAQNEVADKEQKVGLARYALVWTVVLLSYYNIHLYFSASS